MNNIYRALWVAAIGLAASACTPKKGTWTEVKTVTIPTYLKPFSKNSGLYVDDQGQEYVFFAYPGRHCCLDFYTYPALQKVRSIPLDSIPEVQNGIEGIHVHNLDTVDLLISYLNMETRINAKGKVLAHLAYDSLKNEGMDVMQLYSNLSAGPYVFEVDGKQKRIFNSGYATLPQQPVNTPEGVKNYRTAQLKIPRIVMADAGSNRFTADPAALLERIGGDGSQFCFADFQYTVVNDQVVVFSEVSDELYVLSGTDLSLQKTVKIKSDHTQIGVSQVPVTEKNLPELGPLANENRRLDGHFLYLYHDPVRPLLYLTLLHGVARDTPKYQSGGQRPWSILVLDENLEPLDEIPMPGLTYNPALFIPVQDGILIGYSTENKEYRDDRLQFKLFRYETD